MDPGFHCELCSSILSMVQILRKHYKQVHGLSNEEAQAKTAGLKEPMKTCEHCGGEVIRLSRHVCPRVVSISPPQGQTLTITTSDQGVQATRLHLQNLATPKVMVDKGIQTTPPLSKVEEVAQEALAINPELKNNPEFQKLLISKK